jgi:hypothetical protein
MAAKTLARYGPRIPSAKLNRNFRMNRVMPSGMSINNPVTKVFLT